MKKQYGSSKKLFDRDCRLAVRKISKLWTTEGSFTSRRLQVVFGLDHVTDRKFRREINNAGYNYCRARKKVSLKRLMWKTVWNFAKNLKMMVVQKTFGEIPSAFTWMAQDLYINKIQKIRLLSRMAKKLWRAILVLHSKGEERREHASEIHGSHNLQ